MNHNRLFQGIAHLACTRYRAVLLFSVALTIASWIPPFSKGMGNSFDLSRVLPQEVPAARAFTRAVTDFGTTDDAIVVFHLDGTPESTKLAGKAADRVVERLLKEDEIETAYCRKYSKIEKDYLVDELMPRQGLMLLPLERLDEVEQKLQPEAISASVKKTAKRLQSLGTNAKTEKLAILDAMGLASLVEGSFRGASEARKNDSEYIVDQDGKMLLLVIQPKEPAQSVIFAKHIMEVIRATTEAEIEILPAEDKALFDYIQPDRSSASAFFGKLLSSAKSCLSSQCPPPASMAAPSAGKKVSIEYGGGYEAARSYQTTVNWVLVATLSCSFIGVILLFGICFKRVGVIFYIGIPLLMVISWTGGLGCLIFGQLNLISCAFAAILVGLGIDYAIHIYNRYVEERAKGESVEESFRVGLSETGWGVLMGMSATCAAFASLLFTRFNQLAEFGVLGALGIAFSAPAMLFILPALITWRNARNPEPPRTLKPVRFYLPQLASSLEKHRRVYLAAGLGLAVLCVAIMVVRPPRFDDRISNLRPADRAFELSGEVAKAFSNRNPNKILLIACGDTEREAMEEAGRLTQGCSRLMDQKMLIDYESVLRYIPAPGEQEKRFARLAKIDFQAAAENFRKALAENGLDEAAFKWNFDLLSQHAALAKSRELLLPSALAKTPMGRLTRRFVAQHLKRYYLRTELPPEGSYPLTLVKDVATRGGQLLYSAGASLTREQVLDMADRKRAYKDQVKNITVLDKGWSIKINLYAPLGEDSKVGEPTIAESWMGVIKQELGLDTTAEPEKSRAFLAGLPILAHALGNVVKSDFKKITVVIFIICILVLASFYWRTPSRILYAMMPLSLGFIYCGGIMSATGFSFDFVNIMAMPIILGISIDNGIHFVNRYFDEGRALRPMVVDTGRGLLITALANNIGFESLLVSGYQGLNSLGNLTAMASTTVIIASLAAFPVILSTFSPPPAPAPGK